MEVCHERAIVLDTDRGLRIDRKRCTVCGKCIEVCTSQALALYGNTCSVAEIFHEVRRDEMFYGSDGGVTASGGEPLWAPRSVAALFTLCQEAGFSTALETCGFVSPAALKGVLKRTNFVLFDLKHLVCRSIRGLLASPTRLS